MEKVFKKLKATEADPNEKNTFETLKWRLEIVITSLFLRLTVAASTKDENLECVYYNFTPEFPE